MDSTRATRTLETLSATDVALDALVVAETARIGQGVSVAQSVESILTAILLELQRIRVGIALMADVTLEDLDEWSL